MKRIELAGITVALFILLFCGMGIKANCQEKNRLSQITDMNKDIERGYLQEVREGLEQLGYDNAGVTLNKVIDSDGTIEYTLTVHHRRIDRMDEQERCELADIITANEIDVTNSTVTVEYIEYM